MSREWIVERHKDGVSALHTLGIPEAPQRLVRICEPERAAVVLGSTQPHNDLDESGIASMGLDVVRRQSGGGLVLVSPGDMVWIDVFVPANDELWQHDVGRAFLWLGDALAVALASAGVHGAMVFKGALAKNRWSSKVCFAGLGPGELTLDQRKIVGISCRRNRNGALFQCAVLRSFDVHSTVNVLQLSTTDRDLLENVLRLDVVDEVVFDEKILIEGIITALKVA